MARDRGDARAQVLDAEVGHPPALVPREAGLLPDHGGGAARDRLGDEGAPVAHGARVGHEDRAQLHGARVRGEVGERDAERFEALDDRVAVGGGERRAHPALPEEATCASSGGSGSAFTLSVCGASGGIDMRRSAAPMSDANTGAATSPP